ncbi:hypothetical protein AN641_05945 [Candidatus Epulonipiscioides gigas]|nr:hypothetical protein AN641_05945 [Epulopiscium sp. SCG-C07WGA-EpuloA2]
MTITAVNQFARIYFPQNAQQTQQAQETEKLSYVNSNTSQNSANLRVVKTPLQKMQDINDAQNILSSKMTLEASLLSSSRYNTNLYTENTQEQNNIYDYNAEKDTNSAYSSYTDDEDDNTYNYSIDNEDDNIYNYSIEDDDTMYNNDDKNTYTYNNIDVDSMDENYNQYVLNKDWTEIENNLERIQELSYDASKAYSDEYKLFVQAEIDELKSSIDDELKGTDMSLESLGIEDFDVTEDFSMSTINSALQLVSDQVDSKNDINNLEAPTTDTLASVSENIARLKELSEKTLSASSIAYKKLIQGEIDEIKKGISKSLENTNMSLHSLGLSNFDVTKKFSRDTIENAIEEVTNHINAPKYTEKPSETTLNDVEKDLLRIEELSQYAQDSYTDSYKKHLQTEIDTLKEEISKSLEGTNMSLESLGIENYNVTEDFSLDTIYNAIERVSKEKYPPEDEEEVSSTDEDQDMIEKPGYYPRPESEEEIYEEFTVDDTYQYLDDFMQNFSYQESAEYVKWQNYSELFPEPISLFSANNYNTISLFNLM